MTGEIYQPGEFVDVEIKGVRMGEHSHIRVTIEDERGEMWVLPPQAAISRRTPAEWPPRMGDLWRDRDGALWLADLDEGDAFPRFYNAIGTYVPAELTRLYGPLTLVHRESEQDGGDRG